jgi:DNA polymerase-3 subunit epsilon
MTTVDYFVVDVETANQFRHSICQIGIAFFADGKMVDGWESLVNPQEEFLRFNTALHGIGPKTVAYAPAWSEIFTKVSSLLDGAAVASHTHFDRSALLNASERAGIPAVAYGKWIDTCWMARAAWPDLPNHQLASLARNFSISYRAHDALEDARVAGEVLALALAERHVSFRELLGCANKHITGFPKPKAVRGVRTPKATAGFSR